MTLTFRLGVFDEMSSAHVALDQILLLFTKSDNQSQKTHRWYIQRYPDILFLATLREIDRDQTLQSRKTYGLKLWSRTVPPRSSLETFQKHSSWYIFVWKESAVQITWMGASPNPLLALEIHQIIFILHGVTDFHWSSTCKVLEWYLSTVALLRFDWYDCE